MEEDLSGGFGTSICKELCVQVSGKKSEDLYIVQMCLLVGADYAGSISNHKRNR